MPATPAHPPCSRSRWRRRGTTVAGLVLCLLVPLTAAAWAEPGDPPVEPAVTAPAPAPAPEPTPAVPAPTSTATAPATSTPTAAPPAPASPAPSGTASPRPAASPTPSSSTPRTAGAAAAVVPSPAAPPTVSSRRGTAADAVTVAEPATPAAPAAPGTDRAATATAPPEGAGPGLDLGPAGEGGLDSPVSIVLLLGAITLLPALLIMTTAFTRIVIVLGFVRSALGTAGVPPNQVVIGLALFLSLFVMAPTFAEANEQALQPFTKGEISQTEAMQRGLEPFREFMLRQVRDEDLSMFVKLAGDERPASPADVKTTTLVPAFVLSELRTAFLIGFVIFIPFIIIDLIVSAALSAMGMVMLPPVLISLPFKLLLFVAANGWSLVVESLLSSFQR